MKSRLFWCLALVFMLLGGCGTLVEDPRILSRCSPARDLLTKNYKRGANLSLPLFGAGGLFESSGAVLSGAEADRVSKVDAACRAWVYGAISGDKYASVLLEVTSATVVQTTSAGDRAAVVDSVKRYLEDLKNRGLLPGSLSTSAFSRTVEELAVLTPLELSMRLAKSLEPVSVQIDRFADIADKHQVILLYRFDEVDRRLLKLEASVPMPQPTPDRSRNDTPAAPVKSLEQVDVFFSSNSSELNYDVRILLSKAAKAWIDAGVTVDVVGFADPRGSKVRIDALSAKRAKAVASLLKKHNVRVGSVVGGGIGVGSDSTDNDSLRYVRVTAQSLR